MKWLAACCSLIVLFLIVQPVITHFSEEPEFECCGGACGDSEASSDTKEDNCLNTLCNPFLTCCCSIGCDFSQVGFILNPIELSTAIASFYPASLLSDFQGQCWQPPTMVV